MLSIRLANIEESAQIVALLIEAADWLVEQSVPMWHHDEIAAEAIRDNVRQGLFFVAEQEQRIVAAVRFELEDQLFWPDVTQNESAFLHRLVVSRAVAGSGVSTAIFDWAVQRASQLGKRYLRLDCEVSRPKLRAIYENYGFRHHSDRQVGPFFVSRYEYVLAEAQRNKNEF